MVKDAAARRRISVVTGRHAVFARGTVLKFEPPFGVLWIHHLLAHSAEPWQRLCHSTGSHTMAGIAQWLLPLLGFCAEKPPKTFTSDGVAPQSGALTDIRKSCFPATPQAVALPDAPVAVGNPSDFRWPTSPWHLTLRRKASSLCSMASADPVDLPLTSRLR